ncbi:Tannase/feruloyl esterase [Hypoxylon crocopeplum]|nr:Tannase/feruloyl esterase [Hypoxylon crocopeplum]
MSLQSFSSLCQPSTFSPSVHSAEILAIRASVVTNFSASVPSNYRFVQPGIELTDVTFCNVTVTYTHPGANDSVTVESWLPPKQDWNERFQGVGGGGFGVGRFDLSYTTMTGALGEGYATVTTDAGLSDQVIPTWSLSSPGHLNYPLLENFAHLSLYEAAVVGKQLVRSFYGKGPLYSYYNGCSQGGRQGLSLAQRYPTAYDGIAASAPALYFSDLASTIYWPQQYMNNIGKYPHGCELDAIVLAAMSQCDNLDGVTDGLISDVDECFSTFDPFQIVGQSFNCSQTGTIITVSIDAARVVNATWNGIETANGKPIWYGYRPGADLSGDLDVFLSTGMVETNCTGDLCTGNPNYLGVVWFQQFLAKDPNFNMSSMTYADFDRLVRLGEKEYSALLETSDPDLSKFRDAGGKMVTFHGLADQFIPDQGTRRYYDSVIEELPDVHDFYRYFPVPGVGHCSSGRGGPPLDLFAQLRAWVENGTEPESSPITFTDESGVMQNRVVCPYPEKATYSVSCGDSAKADCWSCV